VASASAAPAPGQQPSLAELRALADRHIIACAADPDGWYRLLAAVAADGQQHSFANAALIDAQIDAQQQGSGPAATHDEWAEAGWRIRKGHHAHIWIITEHGDKSAAAAVFTRDQVRPARDGARPALPGVARISAGSPDRALGALVALARTRGYTVARPEDTADGPFTDWDKHTITIPASTPPAAAAAALAHQLAHIVRDADLAAASLPGVEPATGDRPHHPGQAWADCYGVAAVEADSAAWLALTRLGVDPAEAGITFDAAYLWAGPDPRSMSARMIATVGERIVATAQAITDHVDKVLASLPDPPAPAPSPAAKQAPEPVQRRPGAPPVTAADPANSLYPDQALARVNGAAAAFFRARLPGSWAATYLQGRGFGPEICRRWQLGYAPDGWTGLLDHLRAAGYPDELLEAAGLVTRSSIGTLIDVFRHRAMIPIRGAHEQIIGFAGRAPDGAGEQTPKYMNTKTTTIFHKDHVLYGLAETIPALNAGARPVLVEGYFDVIAVNEASRAQVLAGTAAGAAGAAGQGPRRLAGVAPGGTALSTHQLELLAGTCDLRVATPLLVVLDADSGGRKAAIRDYTIITPYSPAATTPVLPDRTDPAAIFEKDGPLALARALTAGEHPLADVAIDAVLDRWADKLQWAEGQLGAARDAARLIAKTMPAEPARQVIRVQERTGVSFDEVSAAIIAALEELEAEAPPKGGPGPDPAGAIDSASVEFPAPPGAATRRPRRPPPRPHRPGGLRPPHR
jgi:DNA primase